LDKILQIIRLLEHLHLKRTKKKEKAIVTTATNAQEKFNKKIIQSNRNKQIKDEINRQRSDSQIFNSNTINII
jgi:hypothetical protein